MIILADLTDQRQFPPSLDLTRTVHCLFSDKLRKLGVEIQWTCFEVKGNDFDVDLVTVEVGLIERLRNTTDNTVGASNRVIQNLLLSITSADYLVCIIGIQHLCGYDETLHILPPFLHRMKTCHAVSQLHAMEGIFTIIMFTRKQSCHRHHSNSWNVHYAQHNNTLWTTQPNLSWGQSISSVSPPH